VGIVIFDQTVRLSVPLTKVNLGSRGDILQSLDEINYRGLFTNSPDAIERAIYELRSNAREDAQKVIVFMTDGIVDTGDAAEDIEKSKWLKDSLASDAADNDIKIFGVAFTEDADFELIQSLAQKTAGEYFRALAAEDLRDVFSKIETIINTPPEPEAPPAPIIAPPVAPAPVEPVIIEIPQAPQQVTEEERLRSTIMMASIAVLVVVMLAIFILLVRRSKQGVAAAPEADTEAFLNDIHGFTNTASYKLSSKPTMLGRVAGKDMDHLDYIVIPESTIGRRHSLIEYKDFAYWIIDQGSINGTYVNDVPVTSEVRLKHGDKVRLHKFEFEFVMPEMVDAGMTVISNTVMANPGDGNQAAPESAAMEETELKGAAAFMDEDDDDDGMFDITGATSDEATVAPEPPPPPPPPPAQPEFDDDEAPTEIRGDLDETQEASMADFEDAEEVTVIKDMPASQEPVDDSEDETIMPGDSSFLDDDATLRKEDDEDEDISLDNFIDLDDMEDDK
jgi:hypothetical protein